MKAEQGYLTNMVESKIHGDALLLTGVKEFLQRRRKFGGKQTSKMRLISRQLPATQPQTSGNPPASVRQLALT